MPKRTFTWALERKMATPHGALRLEGAKALPQEMRKYQQNALDNILKYDRCLVKMFCGTGKSLVMTKTILHVQSNISVIVFPSLSLIQQYSSDYIPLYQDYNVINISSEKLEFHSTTDPDEIDAFLSSRSPKLVLVTYQSYDVLIHSLKGKKITACFDEAHHIVSPEYQKLIFDPSYYERQVFFTATPRNENGIVMYDRLNPELNMCGPTAFDYTFLDGLNDGYLNKFEICVDMFSKNTSSSMYEAIARTVLKHGTNRILTFHSGVNGEKNTSVWNFVDPDAFQKAFDHVLETEFPDKRGFYTKITMRGMDGETPSQKRKRWLRKMDKSPPHEIYLISSCETIGEGVDTKRANMVVFVDPKTSNIKIIQNIGRVLRLNRESPYSVVLVPVFVNLENYAAANGDPVLQDELIKEQMRSERGDYAPIMNVLAALNQEDPDLYELCLTFPNKAHKIKSLQEQGFDIDEDCEYSEEEVATFTSDGVPLEIHKDDSIVRINEPENSDEPPKKRMKTNELRRLYYDSDEDVYRPIITDDDDKRLILPPKKRVSLSIRQDDDIQILWGVKAFDGCEKFGSIVLECSVSWNVLNWHKTHKQLCEYMDVNKKRPSHGDKNLEIKRIGTWVGTQITNYGKGLKIMKDPEIRKVWEETLQKYEYLCDATEQWHKKHKEVCQYMDINKKRPSNGDKNPEIKRLGTWVSHQIKNYGKGLNIMKDPEIRKVWEETLQMYPFLQKRKTYADLSEEERQKICEKYLKKHLKGYKSTNPDDKDIINKVFASDILLGKIIFLDHFEFKTAYALLERGFKPEDMVIPQRQDNFEIMASHELFGSSVVLGEFNDVLESVLQMSKVSGIYADYCSTFEKDGQPFVDLVCKYKPSICEHAVIGVTITLRNPEGVRYAGQDIQMMEKKLCRAFPTSENMFYKYGVVPDDGPYTYGGGAPMATWMIKL